MTPNIAAYQAKIATLRAQLDACDDLVASLQQQLAAANAVVSSLTATNGTHPRYPRQSPQSTLSGL